MKPIIFCLLFISIASCSPDEAYGRVTNVVDGNIIIDIYIYLH